jgi:hypothetical protein
MAAAGPLAPLPKVRLNKYFVSDAEANFFRVLKRVVGDRGHVLAQVSMRPLVVIKLDEPSHARAERQPRDEQIDTILEATVGSYLQPRHSGPQQ